MSILSTSLYGASTSGNRISGMASGLDTDTLVEQMAAGTKNKINRAYQAKQKLLYKQEAYREVSSKLVSFSDKYLSFASSKSTNILSSSFFNSSTIKSSSDYVSVSGNNDSIKNFKINSVTKVAESATINSSNAISKQTIQSTVSSLTSSSSITIDLNGVIKKIDLEDTNSDLVIDTEDLQNKLNTAFGSGRITVGINAGNINFKADSSTDVLGVTEFSSDITGITKGTYNRLPKTSAIGSAGLSTSLTAGSDGKYHIKVNDVSFVFKPTDSLNDIISEINDNTNAGVTLYYSSVTDKITVKSDDIGQSSRVSISDDSSGGNLTAALFGNSSISNNGNDTEISYTLNGVTQTIKRSSLDFKIDDINISLSENAVTTSPVTFVVTKNTEDIVKNVKQFIDDYNEILSLINTKTTERPNKDYQPLTPDQQDEMEKDDIDSWNEQAKKGVLYGDSKMDNVLRKLRNAMSSKTSGSSLTLSDIGIAPASYDTSGKLVFNEETFKTKLNESPEEVMNLFTKTSTEANGISGVAIQIQSILKANIGTFGGTGTLIEEAGLGDGLSKSTNYLSKRMKDYDKRMDELKVYLADEKKRYYNKFTALETALNSLNSQSSWLTSMLGQ